MLQLPVLPSRYFDDALNQWEDYSLNVDLANTLSDDLFEHMIDCEACLHGLLEDQEPKCLAFNSLQKQIATLGGSRRGIVFAY